MIHFIFARDIYMGGFVVVNGECRQNNLFVKLCNAILEERQVI